jgi:hypothetical protein
MIYKIEHELADGSLALSSRERYMMQHPSLDRDCPFKPGDIIKIEEGYFVLNEDLNPMRAATEAELDRTENND